MGYLIVENFLSSNILGTKKEKWEEKREERKKGK